MVVKVFLRCICLSLLILTQNAWSVQWTSDTHSNQELGNAIIEVFDPAEFDGSDNNWYMEQHPNGTMFLANSHGLYSFDGSKWRKHPQSGSGHINQFTILDERIYVGLKGDLGYYTTHAQGELKYQSLLSEIPIEKRAFGSIRNVFQFEDCIYFISAEQIMAYHPQLGLQIYSPEHHFRRAWLAGDRLFATDGDGLIYLKNNQIQPVDVLPKEGLGRIGFVQSLGQDFLIGSMEQGVFLWRNDQLIPWIDANRPEASYLPYNSIHINEKIIAISTLRNGVIFVDHAGQLIYHLNKENGLPAGTTLNLFLDQQQGLWLSHQAQVSRVQLPFELSVFASGKKDVFGVHKITRHQGKLYFAAISGFMSISQSGKTTLLDDVNTSGKDIISVHGKLLLAGSTQCQIYDPIRKQVKTLLKTAKCNDFLLSKLDPNLLFIATGTGILLSEWNGTNWSTPAQLLVEHRVDSKMVEDGSGQIWLTNGDNQLVKIRKQKNEWQISKINFIEALNVPLILDGQLLISKEDGLFRWDDNKSQTAGRVSWFYDYFGDDAESPSFLHRDEQQRIWLSSSTDTGFVRLKDGKVEQWHNYVSAATGMDNLRTIYSEGEITWLGFDKGAVRYNPVEDSLKAHHPLKIRANISETYNKTTNSPLALNLFGQSQQVIESHFENTSIRLFFALSNYLQRKDNQFRYRINEQPWNSWSHETFVDLGQLNGGHYEIQMQAKDPQNQVYTADNRIIYIIPPWYLSKLAIGFYILGLVVMLAFSAWFTQRIRTAKLKEQNLLLEAQVNERTVKVQAQAEELKQQHILKDRFFSNVSHEFRTPLTLTIMPLQDLLRSHPQLDQSISFPVEAALRNSQKLLELIGQVLDINRLESGQFPLNIAEYDIANLINQIIGRLNPWAEQHQQELCSDNINDPTMIFCDQDQLEKCISNLISNAIKYSGDGSQISVSLTKDELNENVGIKVSDNGLGINQHAEAKIFERFYQDKQSEQITEPGTGIGLSLVKELMALHHGHVELINQPGVGCAFILWLKRGEAHFKQATQSDSIEQTISIENAGRLTTQQQNETPDLIHKPMALPPKLMINVPDFKENPDHQENDVTTLLVVDDNSELRHFIALRLSSYYRIIQASNGQEGLARAKQDLPDLIISDVMMPIKNGMDMTRELKLNPDTSTIPIILLTAKSSKRETVEGLQTGADDYLTKPFDTSELIVRVAGLINGRKKLRKKIEAEFSKIKTAENKNQSFRENLRAEILNQITQPNFSINHLASILALSRRSLDRKCQQELNQSVGNFITEVRMEKALNLLTKNNHNVSEVAYAMGFESLAYFSRSFKAFYGKPPSAVDKTLA